MPGIWEKCYYRVDIIVNYLKSKNGFAAVHDKSDPQLISQLFGISKGAFKKTIDSLYKQKMISIERDGIRLLYS